MLKSAFALNVGAGESMNLQNIRSEFPCLEKRHIIYFDNAATTLKPKCVINKLNEFYALHNANIHRSHHVLAAEATEMYEDSRERVEGFINAENNTVAFTKNTTESLNLAAMSLHKSGYLPKGSNVVLSIAEHHSNMLPWRELQRFGVEVRYVPLECCTVNEDTLQEHVDKNTKVVTLAHAYNTTGAVNDVKRLCKVAHDEGALFCLDAAQSVPSLALDVKKIKPDIVCFSGHKMLGPTGIGCMYVNTELAEKLQPVVTGGGMNEYVGKTKVEWAAFPLKFEAGTPPIGEAIGLAEACTFLESIGPAKITSYELKLERYMRKRLDELDGVEVYMPEKSRRHLPIFLFRITGIDAETVAVALNEAARIAVRAGMHCAQPFVSSISEEGLVRASLYIYNTKEEIDIFIETLAAMCR
jgi:cysteine desulfurase/selenocysteine lyase